MRAPAPPFSAAEFRRRAERQAALAHGEAYGDHHLNPALRHLILRGGLTDAAVLIPVVDRGPEATVILTQRPENLRRHAGQIAFPGGRIDPDDGSPEIAAIREAEEEIGLPPGRVEVVGRLPDYVTGSGFRIAPVLSVVDPAFQMKLNPAEVEDAFEVPLAFLMNPANHQRQSRIWQNQERFFYAMPYGERYIWGVTAGIIRALYERLYA
jgi:8-oxo-dGTP pyrophosphatase MutT (NUDIX family)